MKKRNKYILGACAILVASSAIVLTSSASDKRKTISPTPNKVNSPTCCKKSEPRCVESDKKNSSGELIMDNLSRQFISVFLSTP